MANSLQWLMSIPAFQTLADFPTNGKSRSPADHWFTPVAGHFSPRTGQPRIFSRTGGNRQDPPRTVRVGRPGRWQRVGTELQSSSRLRKGAIRTRLSESSEAHRCHSLLGCGYSARSMWNRIADKARSAHPAETLKRVALAPFWLIGQLVGAVVASMWATLRWVFAAVYVGFAEATGGRLPKTDPQIVAQWILAAAVIAAALIVVVF